MRPQDRDGSNRNHAGGRGRSQHLDFAPSRSHGRSRGRSYDFHDGRNDRHNDREMRYPSGNHQYHRSRSSDYAPHSWSHRSRSCDPHPSRPRQTSNSSSHHSYQRNSSHSRKRSRSPERRHHDANIDDRYEQSSRPRSFGNGRPKDETNYDHKRYPLALASTNGAEMHRPPANVFHRNENSENYANALHSSDIMSNMNNRKSYYKPQSRYRYGYGYEHSEDTSHDRHPLASRQQQNFSSNPALQRLKSAHLFNDNHTISNLIQIAHENLAILKPSLTAAFWNKVLKQMGENKQTSRYYEQMNSHLNQIFEHTWDTLSLYGPQDLSQTIYSMAKLVDAIRKNCGRRSGRGEDIIGMLSSRLLNSDMTPKKELFLSFASASRSKLDQFDARNLSNVAYAYALLKYVPEFDDGSDLFDHLASQAVRRGTEFIAQNISNIVWAYATVDKPHPQLFEAMGDQVDAHEHLGGFKPQNLANTVWAYAKAGIYHPKLYEKVANHAVRLDVLYGFNPQHFSNTLWAYSTAGINHPQLFEEVANHIVESDHLYFNQFKPQNLSNTLWAYASAGINHPNLFEKMARHIVESDSLNRFKPQNLSNTVWAYATSQVSHSSLFEQVAKTAIQRKSDFSSQHIANLLWSYAMMGIIDKQLFLSFESTAAKLVDACNKQEIVNIAWAYAVADVDAPTLFNDYFVKKCVAEKDGFETKEFSQLHQWHSWQTKEKSNSGLPKSFADKCLNAFVSRDPHVSELQQKVVAQLTLVGLESKEEVLMGSGYRIDAIVEVNGKKVGIEVDGPSHFVGRSESPLARTILKRRQVPSIDGIELVSVPYWEWDKLGNDEVKGQKYLRMLLGL